MKNIICLFLLSLTLSCAEKKATASIESTAPVLKVSMYDVPLSDRARAINNPYELTYEVKKTGKDQYSLITTMKLFGGSFYVSPHSTRDFSGKFRIEVAPNENLKDFPNSNSPITPPPIADWWVTKGI